MFGIWPVWTGEFLRWLGEDDLLVVECQHGYRQLLQKMIVAYRTLLASWQQDAASFILGLVLEPRCDGAILRHRSASL